MKHNREEALKEFYTKAQADDHDQNFPYLQFEDDDTRSRSLMIDGWTTLEQLKRIVAEWEKLNRDEG